MLQQTSHKLAPRVTIRHVMTIDSGILCDWPGILRNWYDHLSSESKKDKAIAWFEGAQWGLDLGGRTCPQCLSSETVPCFDKDAPYRDTPPYRCLPCGQFFSVRTGTEYDDGRWMWEWLLEFELMLYENDELSKGQAREQASEQAATKIFEDYRWRTSSVGLVCPVCPHCGSLKVSVIESGDPAPYRCGNLKCRKHFSARVRTAFEYGKIPLWRWLEVIIIYGKGGRLTSVALAEKLDVKSQNTALGYHVKLAEAFPLVKSVVPTGASNPTRS